MVAICNSSGAYIYNCSEKVADNRIEKTNESIYARGGMDYDENGNHRMEDGMCGCLFIVPELIDILSQIGVLAAYEQFKKNLGDSITGSHAEINQIRETYYWNFYIN